MALEFVLASVFSAIYFYSLSIAKGGLTEKFWFAYGILFGLFALIIAIFRGRSK